MNKFIATFFYVGLVPKAPGTFGSLAAVPLVWVLAYYGGFWALPVAAAVLYFVGWLAARNLMRHTGEHDPGYIVIDEVVGMLIAAMPIAGVFYGRFELSSILAMLLIFASFRFFDIVKPWPVSYFDKKIKNAHGVMLDDVAAGILAGATISAIKFFWLADAPCCMYS